MNENTTMLLLLAAGAYFLFAHRASTNPAQPPAPQMPAGANQTSSDVAAGLGMVTAIFDAASKYASGTRGAGVGNS